MTNNVIYPVWWDTSVTIYNKYTDPITSVVMWRRTALNGCFWKYASDKLTLKNTMVEGFDILCRIPENSKFLERHEWLNLPNDQMPRYFTLGVGDMIVKGTVTDVIDEMTKGHRSTDFLKKYKERQGVMTIDSVQLNVGSGRCDPHYLVKGA